MKGLVLSVTQLNDYVRKSLAADPMLRQICLSGEISNFKGAASGHWYFSLKDEEAAISCVMFRQAASMVRFRPENGMRVKLFGSVSLYVKTGSYQFYGDMMEQEGLGELYLRFEALKNRLMAEGLFDPSLKKPLPLLPKGIGIITSKTGAVVHDIARVAWRRNPGMPLYLYPVKVQGDGAAQEIVRGIRLMDELNEADVLIVGRGGGSMEDLWAFNEEIVARAIAECHKPVVSAVGHETDFTIADFAADLRAATPSAAAEVCVPTREALAAAVDDQLARMERLVSACIADNALRLERLVARIGQASPEQRVARREGELKALTSRLDNVVLLRLTNKAHRLDHVSARLRTLGPMETLHRGYAIVRKDGKPVKSVHQVEIGNDLTVLMSDGSLQVAVNGMKTEG